MDLKTDWPFGSLLYNMEFYNGWSYKIYHPTVYSPYLWSGSIHDVKAKHAADDKWDQSWFLNK